MKSMLIKIILFISYILIGRYAVKTLVSIYESKLNAKINKLRVIASEQNQELARKQYRITNLETLISNHRDILIKINKENLNLEAKIENTIKDEVPRTVEENISRPEGGGNNQKE